MLFYIFEKGNKQKIAPGYLGFVSILLLIFEEGNKQKIAPGFLRFVSILFNLIIFSGKRCYRDVWGMCVWFYKYCCF